MMKILRRLIENLENTRINMFIGFLIFLTIVSIRIIIEFYLWIWATDHQIIPAFYEEFVYQFTFYSSLFLGGVIIISYFAKTSLVKVIKVVLYGWWVLILPPIIDFIVLGRTEGYRWGFSEDFLKNIFSFGLNSSYIGIGQFIMAVTICFFAGVYVFCKTKSFIRMIAAIISIYFMMFAMGTPELYLPFGIEFTALLYLWYLLLSILFIIFILYKHVKNISSVIKHIKPLRTIHFALMNIIGLLIAGQIDFLWIIDYPYIITSILAVVLIWQFTSLINDIYDKRIDQISNKQRPLVNGLMNESQYLNIALIFLIIALGFGAFLGTIPLILTAVGLALGAMYSVPPVRLKNHILSSCIIGAGSSIAFLIGFYSPDFGDNVGILTLKTLLIAIVIFFSLSMAPLTTDLKDYYGDKKMNVKTLFTVYGREKGKKITSVFLFLTFLIPLVLYHKIIDIALFVGLASFAVIAFYKKEYFPGVIMSYVIVFFYCFLKEL